MTPCKQCGGDVCWVQIDGRWHCHDADGSDHWDTCAKRKWKQVKSTGQRFETAKESGYRNSIHGTKLDWIGGKVVTGKNWKRDGCDCGLPPWEICRPDCAHAIGGMKC